MSFDIRRSMRHGSSARSGVGLIAPLAIGVVGILILSLSLLMVQTRDLQDSKPAITTNPTAGPKSLVPESKASVEYSVTIRQPAGPPQVDVGVTSLHGEKLTVACSTCHTTREPNVANRITADLDEFHRGITFSHGNLTCLACHNPKDYDTLHLADRTPLSFQEVMSLCSQCHGTQRRDYDHGAHGGMTGHWDLSRGPRLRNNCVDCHNPHQPKFPKMNPTFKPRDRFLESRSAAQNEEHHE